MAETERISYDNNEQKQYPGTNLYEVEENALITEEQLNQTEKDIRDYLEANVNSKISNIEANYVAYFPQDKPDIERLNALNNVFPTNFWPDFKNQILSILRDINNSNYSNEYYNIYDYAQRTGATIYYLKGTYAQRGDYGIPILSEYFRDIKSEDIFYRSENIEKFNRVLNENIYTTSASTYNLNTLQNNATIKAKLDSITSDPIIQRNGLRFVTLQNIMNKANLARGLRNFTYDGTNKTFTGNGIGIEKHKGLQVLTQYYPFDYSLFIPEALRNIKEGDILYNVDTNKAFEVKTTSIVDQNGLKLQTWTYNGNGIKTLYDSDMQIDEDSNKCLTIYNSNTTSNTNTLQNYFLEGTNSYSDDFITVNNIPANSEIRTGPVPQESVFYITPGLAEDSWPNVRMNYPYGAFAIPCEEISNFNPPINIWLYVGEQISGGGYEYIENSNAYSFLFSLNGGNNVITTPKVGDYVYNPYSKEIVRIVRDKCVSERSIISSDTMNTYLIEPIPHLILGEYDGVERMTGSYMRGSGEFRLLDYETNTMEYNIDDNTTGSLFDLFNARNSASLDRQFASVILDANQEDLLKINSDGEYIWTIQPSQDEELNNIEKLVEDRKNVILNTYFILPNYIQTNTPISAPLGNFLDSHTRLLQLNLLNPGDIVTFKGISFEIIDRPRLLPTNDVQMLVQDFSNLSDTSPAFKFLISLYHYFYPEDIQTDIITPTNCLIEVNNGIISFKDPNDATRFISFKDWFVAMGVTDSVLLNYVNSIDGDFAAMDYYLRILYYRILMNTDRPIFIKATPINYSAVGKGERGEPGPQGPQGETGARGPRGYTGATGASAYSLAQSTAQANGIAFPYNSQEEWLQSLQGASAYQIAVNNGFSGTEQEWLASLRGEPGTPGTSSSGNSQDVFVVSSIFDLSTINSTTATLNGDGNLYNRIYLDATNDRDPMSVAAYIYVALSTYNLVTLDGVDIHLLHLTKVGNNATNNATPHIFEVMLCNSATSLTCYKMTVNKATNVIINNEIASCCPITLEKIDIIIPTSQVGRI